MFLVSRTSTGSGGISPKIEVPCSSVWQLTNYLNLHLFGVTGALGEFPTTTGRNPADLSIQ